MPGIYAPDGSINVTITGTGGTSGSANSLTPQSYVLLSNASSTGSAVGPVRGGQYAWNIEGNFAGATATLQRLGLDGTTWKNVRNQANTADITATADTSVGVGVGQGASLRVLITGATGTPNLNSTLSGLS